MPSIWPELPYASWKDSGATLHMWLQIVGKYRLAHTPWVNHSWHATFYVSPRGLTTSLIHDGDQAVEITFDVIDHDLVLVSTRGAVTRLPLEPMTVAEFDQRFQEKLRAIGATPTYNGMPNEVQDPVPFAEQSAPGVYDYEAITRFWQALVSVDRVFKHFRTGFLGKVSPVHLFWGSLDLAVTRFSGRSAPLHPGGIPALPDEVTHEAYSHEVSSAGFWPGGGGVDEAMFYAYAYPTPDSFKDQPVKPATAFFHDGMGEFLLPYEAVRAANDPDATLLTFLQSTYAAAADLAGWNREALDTPLAEAAVPRTVVF
ncbi:MAG: DUF5996 family protein [Pseudomonadota bacterium]